MDLPLLRELSAPAGVGALFAMSVLSLVPALRTAFADLAYEIHHVIANGNLVAIHSTMSGRHVAPFAVYTADEMRKLRDSKSGASGGVR